MFTPNYGLDLEINTSDEKDLGFMWPTQYLMLAVTVGIYSVLGIVGNLPVLVVYFKKKDKKSVNTFIRVLGVLDLLVSAVIMPYTLIYELHMVNSDVICRGVEFLRHFTIIASHMTLVAIAVERYCAVCHLSQRFSVQNVNQGMLVVLTVSLILAFPSIGIFALVPASDIQDINCSFPHVSNETMFCHFTTSVVGETVAYVYQGVLMMSFFASLIMIVIFYSIVYSVMWKRTKLRNAGIKQLEKDMAEKSTSSNAVFEKSIYITSSQNSKHSNNTMLEIPPMAKSKCSDSNDSDEKFTKVKQESFKTNYTGSESSVTGSDLTAPSTSTGNSTSSKEDTRISANSMSTLIRNRHNTLHHRTAKMLFLCTLIYVISWIPFWFDIFGATSNIVLRYTFFVGNATNPIVYVIVNKHVRKSIIRIIFQCKRKPSTACASNTTNNIDDKQSDITVKETCDKH